MVDCQQNNMLTEFSVNYKNKFISFITTMLNLEVQKWHTRLQALRRARISKNPAISFPRFSDLGRNLISYPICCGGNNSLKLT